MAAAASVDINTQTFPSQDRFAFTMDTVVICRGSFVVVTLSTGLASESEDTSVGSTASSAYKFVGISIAHYDNSSTSTNVPTLHQCVVDRAEPTLVTFDSVAATDLGKPAYAKSAQVASLNTQSSKAVYLGTVVKYVSSTSAYVAINQGVGAVPA